MDRVLHGHREGLEGKGGHRLQDRCVLIPADEKIAVRAGQLPGEMKLQMKGFGLSCAFVLAAAMSRGVKIL